MSKHCSEYWNEIFPMLATVLALFQIYLMYSLEVHEPPVQTAVSSD
jgi:hypothetical protein